MSEEVREEETAITLHAFGPEAAKSLKRAEVLARDVLVVSKVLSEAQRLQGIVAKLTRQEQVLTQECTELADRRLATTEQLDQINGQLTNNERLLDEARKGAQARIAAELDKWREEQLQARRQEIDGLMTTSQEEYRAATAALQGVLAEVKDTAVVQARLQAAVEILRQTQRDLVGEIAAAV